MRAVVSMLMMMFVLTASMPSVAMAQPIVLNWALEHKPVNYFDKVAKAFKKHVEARSHGRITVVFDKKTNEDDVQALLGLLGRNSIQMTQAFTHELIPINSEFEVFELPFLFDSDDHLTLFSRTPEGHSLFAALEPKGIYAAGYTYSGGQIGILGPKISSLSELNGKTFGIDEGSDRYVSVLKGLGLQAKQTEEKAAYKRIIEKSIDSGETIPWAMSKIMQSPGMESVYFNFSRHKILTRVLLLSKGFLDQLPDDLRTLVIEEAGLLAEQERQIAIEDSQRVARKFAQATHRYNVWTPEQRANDKKLFAPYYREFAEKHTSRLLDVVDALNPSQRPKSANVSPASGGG